MPPDQTSWILIALGCVGILLYVFRSCHPRLRLGTVIRREGRVYTVRVSAGEVYVGTGTTFLQVGQQIVVFVPNPWQTLWTACGMIGVGACVLGTLWLVSWGKAIDSGVPGAQPTPTVSLVSNTEESWVTKTKPPPNHQLRDPKEHTGTGRR